MKKTFCILALAGVVSMTAALCGCNSNPQDTDSNDSSMGTSSAPMSSNPSSGANGSSSGSRMSSESDDLVSAVFWENQTAF